MKLLAIAVAAAGLMMAAPVSAAPVISDVAPIQLNAGTQLAQVDVRIGPGGGVRVGDRDRYRDRGYRGRDRGFRGRDCRTTVVYRGGRRTVIRRCG